MAPLPLLLLLLFEVDEDAEVASLLRATRGAALRDCWDDLRAEFVAVLVGDAPGPTLAKPTDSWIHRREAASSRKTFIVEPLFGQQVLDKHVPLHTTESRSKKTNSSMDPLARIALLTLWMPGDPGSTTTGQVQPEGT